MTPTEEKIKQQLEIAKDDEGHESNLPNYTYEHGVIEALEWILGLGEAPFFEKD